MLPHPIKSWDFLRAFEGVTAVTGPDMPVLDMGSVTCPILPGLHRLGYRDLHGIDLDPRVANMPFAGQIDYRTGDMTDTPWADGTFAAITAISVIEHGFNRDALLAEVARLLRPNGVFLFSTDYWPVKLHTSGVHLFGLDWQIFSAEEIKTMLGAAREHGLCPFADPTVALDRRPPAAIETDRPISYEGRHYTFLYGALVRSAR